MKIEIVEIDIDRLKASPTQPRQHFDEQQQAELTSSIKQHGFTMSALLVRPWPNGNGAAHTFEIVAGERRFRAARSAGVNQVPCIVRELNDQEVLEQQLIENIQRADLTPIEEAHHYKRLLAMRADGEKPLYTIESLAARIGKEARTVLLKFQLCNLPAESSKAVEAGKLPWVTATLIARVPAGEMRLRAEKLILHPQHEEGPLSKRRALEVIHREFIRDLRTAQFEQEDPQLVPVEIVDGERVAGGACTDCPMRQMTGREDKEGSGGRQYVCTNPGCFERKQSSAWKQWQQKETNVEQGRRATTEEESYRLYPTGNQLSPMFGLVDLAQRPDGDDLRAGVDAPGTWRQLTEGRGLQVIVSRDRLRKEHELVEREKAIEAARLNGHTGIWKTAQRDKPKRQDERKAEEKAKADTNEHKKEALVACFDLVNARAKNSHMAGLVALVIQREIEHSQGHEEFFKRHKLPIGGSVMNQIRKRPLAELVAMLVEFVVAEGGYTYEYHPDDKPWLALFDIDYAQVEKRFTAPAKEKKKVAKK